MPERRSIFARPAGPTAKWVVFAIWVVGILIAAGPANLPGKFTDAEENESTSFLPGDAESTKALQASEELQGGELAPAVIIYRREGGLTPADRAKILEDVQRLTERRFPGVVADGATAAAGGESGGAQEGPGGGGGQAPEGGAGQPEGCGGPTTPIPGQPSDYAPFVGPLCSEDGKAAIVTAYLKGEGDGDRILDPVEFWRDTVSDPGGGLEVKITGGAGYAADAIEVFESINGTLLLAALLCLAIAKVNGTSGMGPIVAMGVACAALSMLTLRPALLTIFGRRAFWPFVPHTPSWSLADEEPTTGLGRRIVNGSSVGALLPVVGAALLVVLLLPLVLLNALLRLLLGLAGVKLPSLIVGPLDRRIFKPYEVRRTKHEHLADATHGFWKRVGDRVATGPRRVLIGSTAVLLVLCAGLAFFSTDLTTNDSYRTEVESVEGQELLSQSFPSGATAPTDVIVADPADVPAVTRAVANAPGVEAVSEPVAEGEQGVLGQATLELPPYSTEAFDLVEPIREAAPEAAPGTLVGGATAVEFDVREAAGWDSTVIPPIVLVVVLVILVLLLRAVVAPLILIGTVIVSFLAALGVGYVAFDLIFDFPGSDPSLPLFAFVFLVALGVDYNIFLVARAREETLKHGTREGVLRALAVTGGVITSAGIVLAGTFSVLAVLPLVFLTEIGFVVAFGVLLDTFLVRRVLVPALFLDIGKKVWWPSALAKRDEREVARV